MLFNFNASRIANNLTPWFMRSIAWLIPYVKCILSPLQSKSEEMESFVNLMRAYLKYTGQHKALTAMLNDLYDPISRRIYITEANITHVDSLTLYQAGETNPNPITLYRAGETNPSPITLFRAGEASGDVDFIIVFPRSIAFNDAQVRSMVNTYVECSKSYNIIAS